MMEDQGINKMGRKRRILMETLFFLALAMLSVKDVQAEEAKIYHFEVKTIDGKTVPLSDYKGKALLIVNVASRCGFTPQYDGLEKLYTTYKDKGLEILGFPANNFMGQEPGTNEEIKKFCSLKYNVTFPLFAKISVKGKDMHPLYHYLTQESGIGGDISWNFNKYLVSPEGKVLEHFGSRVEPLSKELKEKVEAVLPKS